jgi:hypothetical protein
MLRFKPNSFRRISLLKFTSVTIYNIGQLYAQDQEQITKKRKIKEQILNPGEQATHANVKKSI